MIKSALYAAIGFAAISSMALAQSAGSSDDRDDLVLEPADFEANIWRDIALINVSGEKAGTTAWDYHR